MQVEGQINQLESEFKDGQELKGLFNRIPNGYAVVVQNLRGKMHTKGPGLKFFLPWDKKYIYYINNVPMNFKKENYKSQEGFEIIVDTAVTFYKSDLITFHVQKNGIEQLKLLIDEILRMYISQHTFEEVSTWTLDVKTVRRNSTDINSYGAYDDLSYQSLETNNQMFNTIINGLEEKDNDFAQKISKKISNFSYAYGISINNIIIQKAELTAELKRSKEDDELTKARNKRMIAIATAELEAAKKRAEASKAQGEAEAKVLEKKLKAISDLVGDAPSAEKLKLLRDYLIGNRASYTVIENGTGDDFYTKANVVANALGKNNLIGNQMMPNNQVNNQMMPNNQVNNQMMPNNQMVQKGKTKVKK